MPPTKRKKPPKPKKPTTTPTNEPQTVLLQVVVPHDLAERFKHHAPAIANIVKLEGSKLAYRAHGSIPIALRYLIREACDALDRRPLPNLPSIPNGPQVPPIPRPAPLPRAPLNTGPLPLCSTCGALYQPGIDRKCPTCSTPLGA